MNYRKLGSLTVSEIGFGGWGIGGITEGATSYGPTDDIVSRKAIQTALRNGINFFDTSNVYGDGHSEQLIGEEVKKWGRKRVIIATKGGLPKHHGQHNLSPLVLRSSLEKSLGRLRTDFVDLYLLHSPDLLDVKSWKAYETLCQLKQGGLVREIGISLKSPPDGLTAIEMGFKILQVNYSMIDQRAWDCGLLELAKEKNVSIIARTPFCFGFLTGKIRNLDFDSRDHRSIWSPAQLQKWQEGGKILRDLNELFNRKHGSQNRHLSELALKFCLYPQAVSTVIPGIQTPQEAAENARASTWPELTPDEIEKIRQIYKKEKGFFVKN